MVLNYNSAALVWSIFQKTIKDRGWVNYSKKFNVPAVPLPCNRLPVFEIYGLEFSSNCFIPLWTLRVFTNQFSEYFLRAL